MVQMAARPAPSIPNIHGIGSHDTMKRMTPTRSANGRAFVCGTVSDGGVSAPTPREDVRLAKEHAQRTFVRERELDVAPDARHLQRERIAPARPSLRPHLEEYERERDGLFRRNVERERP